MQSWKYDLPAFSFLEWKQESSRNFTGNGTILAVVPRKSPHLCEKQHEHHNTEDDQKHTLPEDEHPVPNFWEAHKIPFSPISQVGSLLVSYRSSLPKDSIWVA
jgi:hypothetical protein